MGGQSGSKRARVSPADAAIASSVARSEGLAHPELDRGYDAAGASSQDLTHLTGSLDSDTGDLGSQTRAPGALPKLPNDSSRSRQGRAAPRRRGPRETHQSVITPAVNPSSSPSQPILRPQPRSIDVSATPATLPAPPQHPSQLPAGEGGPRLPPTGNCSQETAGTALMEDGGGTGAGAGAGDAARHPIGRSCSDLAREAWGSPRSDRGAGTPRAGAGTQETGAGGSGSGPRGLRPSSPGDSNNGQGREQQQ